MDVKRKKVGAKKVKKDVPLIKPEGKVEEISRRKKSATNASEKLKLIPSALLSSDPCFLHSSFAAEALLDLQH